jgi:FkbM family methyltransferase
MPGIKTKAEVIAERLGIYPMVHHAYRSIFGRDTIRQKKAFRALYSQLITPHDLVFDVGANNGFYAEVFASLAKRVIAIEPNPECASHVRRVLRGSGVVVAETAVGKETGTAKLIICTHNAMSTMSRDWVKSISAVAVDWGAPMWDREIEVPVVTLNTLEQEYGKPDYIKIDVEGYERCVLEGMSRQPNLLSFEFHNFDVPAVETCLDLLSRESLFNFFILEPYRLELSHWVDRKEILKRVADVPGKGTSGDIFARLS